MINSNSSNSINNNSNNRHGNGNGNQIGPPPLAAPSSYRTGSGLQWKWPQFEKKDQMETKSQDVSDNFKQNNNLRNAGIFRTHYFLRQNR